MEFTEESLRRSARRVKMAKVGAFVFGFLLLVGLFLKSCGRELWDRGHKLSGDDVAAIREALAEAQQRANDEQAKWRKGIQRAVSDGTTGRTDLGPCPIRVPVRGPRSQWQSPSDHPFRFLKVNAGELGGAESPSVSSTRIGIHFVEESLGKSHRREDYGKLALEQAKNLSVRYWTWDITLVVDEQRAPKGSPGGIGSPAGAFVEGLVRGRAFLWDYRRHEVLCAADVSATNSDEVEYEYTKQGPLPAPLEGHREMEAALADDLAVETERQVARSLQYRAGPPRPSMPQEPSP
jgi:hypothetical protein